MEIMDTTDTKIIDHRISEFDIIDINFKCSLSKLDMWENSSHLKLKDPAAGKIYLSCSLESTEIFEERLVKFKEQRRVSVKIMKTNLKPAMATIKLQLDCMDQRIQNFDNWEEECEFHSLPFKYDAQTCLDSGVCSQPNYKVHPHDFSIEVKCRIIWYGFSEDFYAPNLSRVFTRYSENMNFCDMKIKVGDKEYPAHKLILTSQSPVLLKSFTVKTEEPQESSIDLTDFGTDVVEELLLFLYESRIDKAENDEELLLQLLKTGEIYQMSSLKKCCGMLLSNRLTEDNVLVFLENAHVHNSAVLQTRAVAFIVVRKEKFFGTSEFVELGLRYPRILLEICSMFAF